MDSCLQDEDSKQKIVEVYGGKLEMTRSIHLMILLFLRGLRAYHWKHSDLKVQKIIAAKFAEPKE